MEVWALQLFNGLSLSSILLLIALGLALSFGLMNVINLAHGEFIMIGAYTTYALQQAALSFTGDTQSGITFLIAIPVSFVVAGAAGYVVENALIRFLYRRPLDTLLATWGVGLFLQQLARTIFGAPNVQVVAPPWLGSALTVTGDLVFPVKRVFILALARALVREPFLLLLDEPTEGIQPSIVQEIEELLHRLREQQETTILLVEQFLDFALGIADYCYVMEKGAIVLEGAARDLDQNLVREYVAV